MAKGGDFEREISKFLTKWLTGKVKPYMYWRMPGSGGLATIHEENKGLSGDIRAIEPEAEFLTETFSIECKTGYPDTNFWQFFKRIKHFKIESFWAQCVRDANKSNKRPMLIYRKKGYKPLVGLDTDTMAEADEVDRRHRELPSITIHFPEKEGSLPHLALYDFNEFFELTSPEFIKVLGKKYG